MDYEAIILGAGPAGFTAGIYLARFQIKTLLLETLADYTASEHDISSARSSVSGRYFNVPGFPKGIERNELKWQGIQQAKNAGCDYRIEAAYRVTQEHTQFVVHCEHQVYSTQHVIFALGTQDTWPHLPGVHQFIGRCIYWSVESNGKGAENRPAAVLGHNERAVIEAIRLREFTPDVYLLTNGMLLQCPEDLKAILAYLNIPVIQERIKILHGEDEMLSALTLEDNTELTVSFLFVSNQPRHPRSDMAQALGVHVDATGFIHVNDHFETNIPNVFAIGDITSRGPEQVVTSYYHGMVAAWFIYENRFEKTLQNHLLAASRILQS